MKKQFLIVGAGFFGATLARLLAERNFSVLIVDKRPHIGGNAYTREVDGIHVHEYGAHIFHTNNLAVWEFVSRFSAFNSYRHKVLARNGREYYPLPINLLTMNQIFGVTSPEEARQAINDDCIPQCNNSRTVESWCLSNIGVKLYELLVRDYTIKQWRRDPGELPESIIRRLPIRFDFNTDYFADTYQGIPVGGYTQLFQRMLDHPNIEVHVGTSMPKNWDKYANRLIYSGRPDTLLDYQFGELPYLTLDFEHTRHKVVDYQGAAVINHTGSGVKFTRTVEHKHFEQNAGNSASWVTSEFPTDWHREAEPYYPVVQEINQEIYRKYAQAISQDHRIILGGRLGSYQYHDMHQVVASAMKINRGIKQ